MNTCKNPGTCFVILVEDDILLQRVLSMQLETANIAFCAASNGHQALELIKSHHPQVLLLDVSIPGLSGFEIVESIKQDQSLSDLSNIDLIIHTSQDLSNAEREKLTFGRVQFFTKTRASKDLVEIVNQGLARHREPVL